MVERTVDAMAGQRVSFDVSLARQILEHGLREFPNECCGLIAGRGGRPVRVYPMRNADASPVSYRLEPKEQLDVTQGIEDEGLELWGIYHSHTHSEAYPSETDRRQAGWVQPFYPDVRYLLLSLQDREHPELRGFRIVDGDVAEEEVTVP
jgi:[CysO sulfur-carrier protein]-S-L-cysteine hydrolase